MDASGRGVVPSLDELIAMRGVATGRWQARRGQLGVQGQASASVRGRGMEYAESREYTPGDDARHIDWRLTARSGMPHTKLFQAERERLTLVVADAAAEMHFGTRVRFKSVQAARVGAWVAWRAAQAGDRIAALHGSSEEAPVTPASGARGALRVLDALARWYATPARNADLAAALAQARRLLRPGARMIVLTDAARVLATPVAHWQGFAPQHACRVVLFSDPLESDPPRARLRFAVDGGHLGLSLDAAVIRRRWQDDFGGTLQDARALLQRQQLSTAVVSTEETGDGWMRLLDGMTQRGGG